MRELTMILRISLIYPVYKIEGADFKDIDGFGDSVYAIGNTGIVSFNINETTTTITTSDIKLYNRVNDTIKYNTVSAFDISNAVVAGTNAIMHTTDAGKTWKSDKVYINNQLYGPTSSFNITKVSMLDDGRGMAIGLILQDKV